MCHYLVYIVVRYVLTVNGKRYCTILSQFFVPQLNDIAFEDLFFQQDSAMRHTAREISTVLYEFFLNCFIFLFGDQNRPPYLTHLCNFFYGPF